MNVAVVGATGAVGEVMISILEERRFPLSCLYPLASRRSAGREVEFRGRAHPVTPLEDFEFSKADIALFSAGSGVAGEYAPRAAAAGCAVVDNSSCFRYEPDIPLVVPEVNPRGPRGLPGTGNRRQPELFDHPDGGGAQAPARQVRHRADQRRHLPGSFRHRSRGYRGAQRADRSRAWRGDAWRAACTRPRIAFNALPHCDEFLANGYTREEMKIVWETRKILGDESIRVNATAVRVPVFFGHSEAVHIETREKASAEETRRLLEATPGVAVVDEREAGAYPTPVTHAWGADEVFVGRIREDISHPRGLDLWVVSDNLRKGAALNTVQIAEMLVRQYL